MANNTVDDNPKSREMALKGLEASSGWGIFCARYQKVITAEFDKKIFDPKLPAAQREILVNARALVMGDEGQFTPEKIIKSLIVAAEGEVERIMRGR